MECTGISAVWCPNCGECTCPDREESMNHEGCPLHSWNSKHGEIDVIEDWEIDAVPQL
jgi:hypothetical protein